LANYTRTTLYITATVSLLMSATIVNDYQRERPDSAWPIVRGKVVQRSSEKRYVFVQRPKLTIWVEPNGPSITAVLMTNSSSSIPDSVSFRYSGNPEREVLLLEETSPILVAALVEAIAPLLFFLWPWYERSMKKRANGSSSDA
jgi:hypothetical protein